MIPRIPILDDFLDWLYGVATMEDVRKGPEGWEESKKLMEAKNV